MSWENEIGRRTGLTECHRCGRQAELLIGRGFWAKPIGSFSLAGAQLKVSAIAVPSVTHDEPECGWVGLIVGRKGDGTYKIVEGGGRDVGEGM